MQRHVRPQSVRQASAARAARERRERVAAMRAETDAILSARGYTVTRLDFSSTRGTYTIDFHATDDPESRYVARDEDARLRTIRTYPQRHPFDPAHPRAARFVNTASITGAFLASARAGFDALADFAAPPAV